MWGRARRKSAGLRRLDESLDVARRHLELAESTARGAGSIRRLQVLAVLVAVVGVAISLLVWQPWTTAPLPKALVTLAPGAQNAIVPASIRDLTAPPRYPVQESGDHCATWNRWFDAHKAASVWPPLVQIAAPIAADVTVIGASIHVFRSYVPKRLSFIECVHGAGPIPGTILTVDLAHPNSMPTIVADDGADAPLAMPDAVINVDPGHTEYIAVTARGAHRFYEWSVTLRLSVAERTRTITFGSVQHPLRSWLGHPPADAYDYPSGGHSWTAAQ